MKPEIIVALDVPAVSDLPPVLDRLPPSLNWYKVGLELYTAAGPGALAELQRRGRHIFLDLKLHDIPRTVARSVTSAGQHHVQMLTLHASGGRAMMQAAADAARDLGPTAPLLLAVTVLTSLDDQDFADLGIQRSSGDHVLKLAELAVASGIRGLVCSPHEVGRLRKALGPEITLVTPGIRPGGGGGDDQKRTGTPAQAARDGASFLVIGRPILEAPDPAAATAAIVDELNRA